MPLAIVAISVISAGGFVAFQELAARRAEAVRVALRAETLEDALGESRTDEARIGRLLARAESQLERGRLSRADLEQTVSSVHSALDGALERMASLRERADSAERLLGTERSHRTQAETARDREVERASTLARELSSRASDLSSERGISAELRSRIATLDGELARVRTDLDRTQSALAYVDAEASTAEARAETLASRLADANARMTRLELELETARARTRQIERESERGRAAPPLAPTSGSESTL